MSWNHPHKIQFCDELSDNGLGPCLAFCQVSVVNSDLPMACRYIVGKCDLKNLCV